jgi:hypothetical protein
MNPSTCPTRADLSRADHRVLHELCSGADVVEFGCGGSTLFLSQIARTLLSFDTSAAWIERVRKFAATGDGPRPILNHCTGVPAQLPKADVYFVDGLLELRAPWVHACLDRRLARTIIVHDSRRASPVRELSGLLTWPRTAIIERVEYHYKDSNCVVITTRPAPLVYENWNETEPENRLPSLDKV